MDFAIAEGPQTVPLAVEALAGLRVLVVDDNETNRKILHELLTHWGMGCALCSGGAEALDALAEHADGEPPFAIALLDVMMPLMDGFELAEKIRQQPRLAELRILMLTSQDSPVRSANASGWISPGSPEAHEALLALGVHHRRPRCGGGDDEHGEAAEHDEVISRQVLLVEDNPVNRRGSPGGPGAPGAYGNARQQWAGSRGRHRRR